VLQILAMGNERNHAADAMAHHPRIESLVKLGKEAEATWLQIGASFLFSPHFSQSAQTDLTVARPGQTAEAVGDLDRAIASYEAVLRHNAFSIVALSQIAAICRSKEEFKKAAEYFGRVVGLAPESGDVWGALGAFRCLLRRGESPGFNPFFLLFPPLLAGHCYLMIDDLKKAYSSYQQALYYMPNPHVRLLLFPLCNLLRSPFSPTAGTETLVRHRYPLRSLRKP
jgi:glucose repression mediator protein